MPTLQWTESSCSSPLPAGLDEGPLLMAIDPEKDADGLHTLNLGRLLKGEPGPRSCTPAG